MSYTRLPIAETNNSNRPARQIARLAVLFGLIAIPGLADSPLVYHGGPVLTDFTISAVYYGSGWTQSEIDAQQNYLVKLAGYLSGSNSPHGSVSMMAQYGVQKASVAGAAQRMNPTDTPHHVSRTELLQIIHTAQANHLL